MKGKLERVAVSFDKKATITIATEDKAAARNLWDDFRDVEIEVTVKKYRKKRSLDANAYFWKLIGDIAYVLGISATEVYRDQVKSCGLYDTLIMKTEAVGIFTKAWEQNGVGWFALSLGRNRTDPSMTDIICYYGSSVYDTAQFSRLVESVITECKELGIPYETDAFTALLKDAKHTDKA